MYKQMFATFDFNNGVCPSSINRHAILHGEIFDSATEAISLRVFLMLDTLSQFIQVTERRRKASAERVKLMRTGPSAKYPRVPAVYLDPPNLTILAFLAQRV